MFTVYIYDYEMHEEMILTHGNAKHCYYQARSSARLYVSLAIAPFRISVVNDETAEIVTSFDVSRHEALPFDSYCLQVFHFNHWREGKGRS